MSGFSNQAFTGLPGRCRRTRIGPSLIRVIVRDATEYPVNFDFTLCIHGRIQTIAMMDTSVRVHRTLFWGTLTWRIFTAVENNNKNCE